MFSSLLLWRVRLMFRGRAVIGRAEAASYGVLVAAHDRWFGAGVSGGLAEGHHEDLAWSVALTIAGMFALLGVAERPSWGRVAAAGVLVLAANLDRSPTGYACALGALLMAGWLLWADDRTTDGGGV